MWMRFEILWSFEDKIVNLHPYTSRFISGVVGSLRYCFVCITRVLIDLSSKSLYVCQKFTVFILTR